MESGEWLGQYLDENGVEGNADSIVDLIARQEQDRISLEQHVQFWEIR